MLFQYKPKSLIVPAACKERAGMLSLPHMLPLRDFVESLRNEMGPEYEIPHFDPLDGGINAQVLFLLEAPGSKAVASGFVSRHNPDETAKNFFEPDRQTCQKPQKHSVCQPSTNVDMTNHNISEGVRQSWEDPSVRERRQQRHGAAYPGMVPLLASLARYIKPSRISACLLKSISRSGTS